MPFTILNFIKKTYVRYRRREKGFSENHYPPSCRQLGNHQWFDGFLHLLESLKAIPELLTLLTVLETPNLKVWNPFPFKSPRGVSISLMKFGIQYNLFFSRQLIAGYRHSRCFPCPSTYPLQTDLRLQKSIIVKILLSTTAINTGQAWVSEIWV